MLIFFSIIIEYVFQALDVLNGSDHLRNSSFIVFILIIILSTVNIVFLNISFVMLCNCVCQDFNMKIFIKMPNDVSFPNRMQNVAVHPLEYVTIT